jgi:hypothetical protein
MCRANVDGPSSCNFEAGFHVKQQRHGAGGPLCIHQYFTDDDQTDPSGPSKTTVSYTQSPGQSFQ